MNRMLFILMSISFAGCSKLPSAEESDDIAAASETDDGDTEATDVSETGTEDDENCEPECVCHPPEWVCMAPDSEVTVDNLCTAKEHCWHQCNAPYCPGGWEGDLGDCESQHTEFWASASQNCIDLLMAAETCYFGLTCAELLPSACEPTHPCYQHWIAYSEADCGFAAGPACE